MYTDTFEKNYIILLIIIALWPLVAQKKYEENLNVSI